MCRFTLPCITWVCVHSDTAAEASHVVSLKIYGYIEYHQRIHCIHINMSQIYGCAHPIAMVSRIIFVIKSYGQYIMSYSKGAAAQLDGSSQ